MICLLYISMSVSMSPTLTPVLVSAVWRPVPWRSSLFAGVVWCGWAGAGRGHGAGQVSVHVIRVCAAHGAAARRRRWHRRHAADAERSAARGRQFDSFMSCWFSCYYCCCIYVHTPNYKWSYLDFLEGFPTDSTWKHERKEEKKSRLKLWNQSEIHDMHISNLDFEYFAYRLNG